MVSVHHYRIAQIPQVFVLTGNMPAWCHIPGILTKFMFRNIKHVLSKQGDMACNLTLHEKRCDAINATDERAKIFCRNSGCFSIFAI